MDTLTRERGEAEVAQRQPGDAISAVVGSPIYSTHHRFDDLRMSMFQEPMNAGALTVSRFYFGVTPKVVVDVIEHQARFRSEITAKRAYCLARGIRYVLVADDFDDEGVRKQLAPMRVTTPARRPRTTADAKPRRPRTRKTV